MGRARLAALAGAVILLGTAAASHAQSRTVRFKKMGFHERGKHLTLTTSFTEIFDAKSYKKLSSGFVSTLVVRIYVYKKGSSLPVSLTFLRARIVYDLWDERYIIRIDGPDGRRNKKIKSRAAALRAITELYRLPVAELSKIPRGPHHFVGVVVELNPISAALLAEVRRWLTRKPGKSTLDRTSSFFGSFVSVFVNPKVPEAARVLRLRSQPFYRIKKKAAKP
jgi:hypothetical protein